MVELAESEKDHYPYRFDFETAMRPVRFMEKFLVPTKGNYNRIQCCCPGRSSWR
jgi:hypothetical protein